MPSVVLCLLNYTFVFSHVSHMLLISQWNIRELYPIQQLCVITMWVVYANEQI